MLQIDYKVRYSSVLSLDNATGLYEATVPLRLPSLYVPGSARGRIQVIGKLLLPTLYVFNALSLHYNISLIDIRTNLGKQTVSFSGAQVWNTLPKELRNVIITDKNSGKY